MAETKAARFACTIFFLTLIPVSQGFAQSETLYDVEFTQICLIDSIAPDTLTQFWRFTHANNPGGITRDFTYDLSGAYIPTGTVLGCNDYYLGDNPEGFGTAGTLAIWTGTETLGNSSLTESAEEAVWDLTGSLTVPSGTDAQVPVWGAGKLRYNTTTGGFQGGQNGYFLPWANTPTFTNGSVLISDGSKITQDNTGLFFDAAANELRIGSNTDLGAIILQVHGAARAERLTVRGSFATQEAAFVFNENTSGGSHALYATSQDATYAGTSNIHTVFFAGQNANISSETYAIRIDPRLKPTGSAQGFVALNSGRGILWRYDAGGTTYSAARIIPIVARYNNGSARTKMVTSIHYNSSMHDVMINDSIGLILPQYGSGTITGTATQNAAFDAAGKVIERAFAYAEMSIDDANPDTISITSGTPAEGTDWTAGELANFTYSAGRLTYTGSETAKFLINTTVSFSFNVGNTVIEAWIYKNGAEVTKSELHRKIGTAGDVGNGGQTCILELAQNDYIELFFDADNNGNVIIQNANVNLVKI